ncbi:MAG TPA: nitrate- and nitrite sensing domain-containing protein [Pseudohongiella sp.]|nr:nitrate- and nitrite sensing domain-containing protein [Pseudohongiella sp.]
MALGTLVTTVSDLVHKLQRERGASNLYLGSSGDRFSLEREQLCCVADAGITDFRKPPGKVIAARTSLPLTRFAASA